MEKTVCIGHIYKLKNNKYKGCPLDCSPCRQFNDPHKAEEYIRFENGVHPVVKSEYAPLKYGNGIEVWIRES